MLSLVAASTSAIDGAPLGRESVVSGAGGDARQLLPATNAVSARLGGVPFSVWACDVSEEEEDVESSPSPSPDEVRVSDMDGAWVRGIAGFWRKVVRGGERANSWVRVTTVGDCELGMLAVTV